MALGNNDRDGLWVFFFHVVSRDRSRDLQRSTLPYEGATPAALAGFIESLRDLGVELVSVDQISAGLDQRGACAHLTFDDGYANNLRLLDIVDTLDAPVTVFPSVDHVETGKAFWWDIVYRNRVGKVSRRELNAEIRSLKRLRHHEIDRYLLQEFGPLAFSPAGDEDRPLSIPELQRLAGNRWIRIGNHTMNHAILPNYQSADAADQVAGAQRKLASWVGTSPTSIAYPSGSHDAGTVRVAAEAGLDLGFTIIPGRNPRVTVGTRRMRLRRIAVAPEALDGSRRTAHLLSPATTVYRRSRALASRLLQPLR